MSHASNSLLPIAARLIIPVQVFFALYLLLRGHNLPGGGFIGGLVLASAIVLRVMVRPGAFKGDLIALSGIGLLVALVSASLPLAFGLPFFTGLWGGEIWLPTIGKLKLGTPLLFDIGVFLVVTGVGAKMLLVLLAEHHQAILETPER